MGYGIEPLYNLTLYKLIPGNQHHTWHIVASCQSSDVPTIGIFNTTPLLDPNGESPGVWINTTLSESFIEYFSVFNYRPNDGLM